MGADRSRRNLEASSTPGRADRERESPRPQHARRLESGAGPRRRRVPQNAWLQTLLRRPAQMKADTKRYFRPAVFICDEYQSFASVGEDDPSGDEKAFAPHPAVPRHPHRRHPVHILAPIRPGNFRGLARSLADAPHPDLPLPSATTQAPSSPRNSAARWPRSNRAGPSPNRRGKLKCRSCPARPGAARGRWEPASHSGNSGRLYFSPGSLPCFPNCQAICLPYDGTHATSAVRVYLKPYYLPETMPYWRAVEAGKI